MDPQVIEMHLDQVVAVMLHLVVVVVEQVKMVGPVAAVVVEAPLE